MHSSLIRNKELSWLAFNERVLQEAQSQSTPLIERLRFCGIFSSNLDEFFRVRVALLIRLAQTGQRGLFKNENPLSVLKEIHRRTVELNARFEKCWHDLRKKLEKENIFFLTDTDISGTDSILVKEYFHKKVRPFLFPVMLESTEAFPRLESDALYMAVSLHSGSKEKIRHALFEIPVKAAGRFFLLPPSAKRQNIILLEDVIRLCLPEIFNHLSFSSYHAYTIKLTRDSELDIDGDYSDSIMRKIGRSLVKRKIGSPVRFVYDREMPAAVLNLLKKRLKLKTECDLISGGRIHSFRDFTDFPDVGGKHLRYPVLPSLTHPRLKNSPSFFNEIDHGDILFHFPFQSFGHVIDYLREASIDPQVTHIRMTVYRAAKNSNVIQALINAARNSKKVTAVLELQARFDEEANLNWSRRLTEEGVKVVPGVPGLKVHCKLLLISRKTERSDKEKHYALIGTGNFNETTAAFYTDHALITSGTGITEEVLKIFNFFEKNYQVPKFSHMLISPFNTRRRFLELIEAEISEAQKGNEAALYLKMNNLTDSLMIAALTRAAESGVKVRLMIRGMYCLKSESPQVSANLQARAVVDRYLEHTRIFYFHAAGRHEVFIGSADWMPRNLDNRVECICPVADPVLKSELIDYIEGQWRDKNKARILDKDLANRLISPDGSKSFQEFWYNHLKANK